MKTVQTLPHYWSNDGFKNTVVNPTKPSLHRGSLEITLTVSLREFVYVCLIYKFPFLTFCFWFFYIFQSSMFCSGCSESYLETTITGDTLHYFSTFLVHWIQTGQDRTQDRIGLKTRQDILVWNAKYLRQLVAKIKE